MPRIQFIYFLVGLCSTFAISAGPTTPATHPNADELLPAYQIYAGNTHAHTAFTWSHGDQWTTTKPAVGAKDEPGVFVDADGAQHPGKSLVLKPGWEKSQGPPSEHFALAKANGYDFYITTDHSQEADFQPPSPGNANWSATKRAATEMTDAKFVALSGVEHSENNGPGGVGHINVINTAGYLNAMAPGIDLPYLYKWLKTAPPNDEGPVVATFNHPGPHQYNNWADRDPEITDIITMLEVINSNNQIHYEGFVNALNRGWKVSPVCGNDNHGLWGITHQLACTFVVATEKTKAAILDAMKHRRTYASLDHNIQCKYTVNGAIMGSTLERPDTFEFDISISDPDIDKPKDRITKIDIVKDGGIVAETYIPTPAHAVTWKPVIHDSTSKFFFIRVWSAGGGDAPKPNPTAPMTWLAPVWSGR